MKNAIIAVQALIILVAVLFSLMTVRAYQDQKAETANTERKLYSEQLKREYFEWRESNATGHTVDKSEFPRMSELNALSGNE
jgi:hypothetical protein